MLSLSFTVTTQVYDIRESEVQEISFPQMYAQDFAEFVKINPERLLNNSFAR